MQQEIILLSLLGFLVSLYAIYVEKKAENKKYKPICDLTDKISCTKALTSKYGKIFKIKNSIFGIIFYSIIFILSLMGNITFIFYNPMKLFF